MLEGVDYLIIDPENGYEKEGELAKVKIFKGEFSGIEYSYGVVNLDPDENDNEIMRVKFEYEITDEIQKESILSDNDSKKRFQEHIGLILNSILLDSIEKAEERYQNELREENTQTLII